jgi:hypothetical protein
MTLRGLSQPGEEVVTLARRRGIEKKNRTTMRAWYHRGALANGSGQMPDR